MCWRGCLCCGLSISRRDDLEVFAGFQSNGSKIAPVERERRVDLFAIGQMEQRHVCELKIQIAITMENVRHRREIARVQRRKLEWTGVKGLHQDCDRRRIMSK